jgi:hypothetical protein
MSAAFSTLTTNIAFGSTMRVGRFVPAFHNTYNYDKVLLNDRN